MEQILTVAGTEQGQQLLQQLLGEMGITKTVQANTGLDARRFLETQSFELAVISAPLTDEYGEGVARLAYQQGATVILLARTEHADAIRECIGKMGIYLLAKPVKRAIFLQLLQCILLQQRQKEQLLAEKEKLQRQIQDANLLNRAKLVLIQVLKMTEPQAHRYIEKQAMDLRITRREVAEGIISRYEN